jgi:hypothetical protein
MVHRIPNPNHAKSQYGQGNHWQIPVPAPFKDRRKPQAHQITLNGLIAPGSLEMGEQLLGRHVQTTGLSASHTVGSWGGSRTSDEFLTSVERNFLNGTRPTG